MVVFNSIVKWCCSTHPGSGCDGWLIVCILMLSSVVTGTSSCHRRHDQIGCLLCGQSPHTLTSDQKKNPALWSTQCGEQLVACSGTGELPWPCAKEWCRVHTLDAEMYMITSIKVCCKNYRRPRNHTAHFSGWVRNDVAW